MANDRQCEFFLLRYVPDALRDEFVNIGVVLVEKKERVEAGDSPAFAGVRFTHDWRRVRCLDAAADLDMLQALESELRARLADDRDLILRKMDDAFSTAVQLSAAKALLTDSPEQELARLAEIYLEPRAQERERREPAGRAAVFHAMRAAFERAGVWELPQMRRNIAVAPYTRPGDPLKLDCGYRPNGVVKLFHAVSLAADPNLAKVLAFSFPQVREGLAQSEQAKAELTAIVEAGLDREDEPVAFALETLVAARIQVATTEEMDRIADTARVELRA